MGGSRNMPCREDSCCRLSLRLRPQRDHCGVSASADDDACASMKISARNTSRRLGCSIQRHSRADC